MTARARALPVAAAVPQLSTEHRYHAQATVEAVQLEMKEDSDSSGFWGVLEQIVAAAGGFASWR